MAVGSYAHSFHRRNRGAPNGVVEQPEGDTEQYT